MAFPIEENFTYHAPIDNSSAKFEKLRSKAKELAYEIEKLCPNSREKSLAFTNLEQSIMWANAAIARNQSNISECPYMQDKATLER